MLPVSGFADSGSKTAVAIAFKSNHFAAGAQLCARLLGRQRQKQVESCVIELPILVGHSALAAFQLRQGFIQLMAR